MLGFVVAVAVWAFQPWTSAASLPPVANKRISQATFVCGAPLGGGSVHPSNHLARSGVVVRHQPCSTRGQRRGLAVFDLVVGSVGVVVLVAVKRSQPAAEPA